MKEAESIIRDLLLTTRKVDWLIMHEIAKRYPKIEDVQFSFVDGKESEREPFKTNQGYISLKKHELIEKIREIIIDLAKEFKGNNTAIANLFIIATRVSYTGDDQEALLEDFKNNVNPETRQAVFNLLINSLNEEYYKHYRLAQNKPTTVNDWLDLFRDTDYLHGYSDPQRSSLLLVKDEHNLNLNFDWIEAMSPLLRAVLIGKYAYKLQVNSARMKQLYSNEDELGFFAACLINYAQRGIEIPNWLSENLAELFINDRWHRIGHQFFIHVYGLSFRNKNESQLTKKLQDDIHAVLYKKITEDSAATQEWIARLSFPDEFIALLWWLNSRKIKHEEIHAPIKQALFKQFVSELRKMSDQLPIYMASEKGEEPFKSFQLYQEKYKNIFAHLLLFSLHATEQDMENLRKVCFEIKPLFYGGYRARKLATHFTEILILIGLSATRTYGFGEEEFTKLKSYLKIICDTVLIPYTHLTESEEDVWYPDTKRPVFQYDIGGYLIRTELADITKHKIYSLYKEFFKCIDNVKVARWSYES